MEKYSLEDIQNAMNEVMEKYARLNRKSESEVEDDKRLISKGFNLLVDAIEGHLPKV